MGCNSAIYVVNTNNQAIPATTATTLNFGQIVRRFGNCIDCSGGNVSVNAYGFYDVAATIGFTAAAGEVTIQLYTDGTAIPGATATITAVADTEYSVTVPCIIRNTCCCDKMITATVTSGAAAVISNATIKVEKL